MLFLSLFQTYNITLLCNEDYVVEPVALRFLVEHAFDFNKQYSQGVSYYRGKDKVCLFNQSFVRNTLGLFVITWYNMVGHLNIVSSRTENVNITKIYQRSYKFRSLILRSERTATGDRANEELPDQLVLFFNLFLSVLIS